MKSVILFSVIAAVAVSTAVSRDVRVVVSSEVNQSVVARKGDVQTHAVVVNEFERVGLVPARKVPVSGQQIAALVAAALPGEVLGQQVAVGATPDVVLAVNWGEVSPAGAQPVVRKKAQGSATTVTQALVFGLGYHPMVLHDRVEIREELGDDRFFLMLTAYDGEALRAGREEVRWQTRISADSIRNDGQRVWSALAAAAADFAGRDLARFEFAAYPGAPAAQVAAAAPAARMADVMSPRATTLPTALF
jgi:hypothetical protein